MGKSLVLSVLLAMLNLYLSKLLKKWRPTGTLNKPPVMKVRQTTMILKKQTMLLQHKIGNILRILKKYDLKKTRCKVFLTNHNLWIRSMPETLSLSPLPGTRLFLEATKSLPLPIYKDNHPETLYDFFLILKNTINWKVSWSRSSIATAYHSS